MTPHQSCPTRPALLCSPVARLGLAANNPDLRSGLPRRFSRGRRCGGVKVTDPRARELSRLRIKAGLSALVSHEEAVNWIAFRQVSAADLTGKAEFGAKWVAAYAEGDTRRPEPSEDGSDCSVLRALRALAECVPVWTPSTLGDPGWQAYIRAHPKADFVPPAFLEIEHAARHLVGKFGRSAAELAAEMQTNLDAYAKRKVRVDAAERGLDAAQIDGLLRAERPWPARKYKGVDIIDLWPEPKSEAKGLHSLPRSPMAREAKLWAAQRFKTWPKDQAPPSKAQDWEDAKAHWPDSSHRPSRDVIFSVRPTHWPVKPGRPSKRPDGNSRK